MGRIRYFLIFLFLLSISYQSKAQSGCYVSSDANIYTSSRSNGTFRYSTGATPILNANCVSVSGTVCDVYDTFIIVRINERSGYLSTYAFPCPLDNYIWLLILPLGGLGFHYMRKRSLLKLQDKR